MPIQVTLTHKYFTAIGTPVRRVALRMQPHVLVKIRRVAERPRAHFALQRLVARVRAQMYFQTVLAIVDLATEEANMRLLLLAHLVGNVQLDSLRAVQHGYLPVDSGAVAGARVGRALERVIHGRQRRGHVHFTL